MTNSITKEHDLETDLMSTDWILEKARVNKCYAQNLYAVMCNNEFTKLDLIPVLKNKTWSCSWRYAGGVVAEMRQEGDYMDWYCSGIRDTYDGSYVPEGCATDEIRADLQQLGWIIAPGGDWEGYTSKGDKVK